MDNKTHTINVLFFSCLLSDHGSHPSLSTAESLSRLHQIQPLVITFLLVHLTTLYRWHPVAGGDAHFFISVSWRESNTIDLGIPYLKAF